ncbi:hypothetical protein RJT34_26846 [Clitoria ternatea]|uniref:Uncharacterized protein n=1 Tax=Clitoria ternatea TaxID=43366 RepID=A0AAN9F9D8_CLITE
MQNIASVCPTAKEAVIWYNKCSLRYSYRFIFSKVEKWPRYQSKIPLGEPLWFCVVRGFTTLWGLLLVYHRMKQGWLLLFKSRTYMVLADKFVNVIHFGERDCSIQVEHPVTEMISSTDLIEEQICVAMGENLRRILFSEDIPLNVVSMQKMLLRDLDRGQVLNSEERRKILLAMADALENNESMMRLENEADVADVEENTDMKILRD